VVWSLQENILISLAHTKRFCWHIMKLLCSECIMSLKDSNFYLAQLCLASWKLCLRSPKTWVDFSFVWRCPNMLASHLYIFRVSSLIVTTKKLWFSIQNNAKFRNIYYSNETNINLVPYSCHYKKNRFSVILACVACTKQR